MKLLVSHSHNGLETGILSCEISHQNLVFDSVKKAEKYIDDNFEIWNEGLTKKERGLQEFFIYDQKTNIDIKIITKH